MKRINFFLLFIIISSITIGCNNCSQVKGIKIPELLNRSVDESYCKLLERALELDKDAIIEISVFDVFDSASYEHGYVLIRLIEKIGEEEYLKAIKNVSVEQKKSIESYLWAGLEYGGNKIYSNKKLNEVLPLLAESLKQ